MITDKNIYSDYFEEFANKVNSSFAHFFSEYYPKSLYDPCDYIMSGGGKRLRPFLVHASANCVSSEQIEVFDAALAVELLHNFTLVHDDIMDNSSLRRGRDTLHVKYDLSTAILSGDSMIAFAYKSLLKNCNNNNISVIGDFTDGIIEVCEGQSLDKDFELRIAVKIEEYTEMIRKKTAALAKMCCMIGGKLGNGTNENVESLSNFGLNLGIAFQIQDDLLDIIGNEQEFGKVTGSDLIEGKKTFLLLKALELAENENKNDIEELIRNKGILPDKVEHYKKIFQNLGVIEIAKAEIEKYSERALLSLNNLNSGFYRDILIWLTNALIKRNK